MPTFTALYRKKMKKPADMERDMRAAFNALDKEGYARVRARESEAVMHSRHSAHIRGGAMLARSLPS